MKRLPKWAGILLVSIIILILTGSLVWESAGYYILKRAIFSLAAREHVALEVNSIHGKIFSETTIEQISLRPAAGRPQSYYFTSRAITCSYNLWDLRHGFELFLKGLKCSADSPGFVYDMRAVAVQAGAGDASTQFVVPAVLPGLDLRHGSVVLRQEDWDLQIEGIDAALVSDRAHELQLRGEKVQVSQEGVIRIETGFTTLLRYADNRLSIASLEIGAKDIEATGYVDLSRMAGGAVGFAADLLFAESGLALEGSLEKKLLKVRVETDNFDVGELQRRLGGEGFDIAGKIRTAADLVYNPAAEGDLEGSFELRLEEGKLHGVDVETLYASGNFDGKTLKIPSAELGTPGNSAVISDISMPLPLFRSGDWLGTMAGSRAEFAVALTDSANLLQLLDLEEDILPDVIRPESLTVRGSLDKGILHIENGRAQNEGISLFVDRAVIPLPADRKSMGSMSVTAAARLESSNVEGLAGLFSEIPISGQAVADISISGSIREPAAVVDLKGEDLIYREMQLGLIGLHGDVSLSQEKPGAVTFIKFEISEMTQENGTGILELLSPLSGTLLGDTLTMQGAFLLDAKGEISVDISRTPAKEITAEISTHGLDSDGWLGNFIDNRYFFHGADIEAVLKSLPDDRQLMLSGIVREAGGTGVPFPLSGSFIVNYSPRGIEIEECTWKSHERNQLTVNGFLPYDPLAAEPFLAGDMLLKGQVDFPALEDVAVFLEPWGVGKGSVALDMELKGSWQKPEGYLQFQMENIEPSGPMRKYMDSAVNFSGDIVFQDNAMVLQSATLESSAYTAQATGSWNHNISALSLLQDRPSPLQGDLTAAAKFKFKDLNFLRSRISWLRRLEGDMQGEINLSGPVTSPSLQGSFSLKEGEVSHTFNFPTLSAVNLQGDFDKNSLTIKNMRTEVGGSPVKLEGGINKEAEKVSVNLNVEGKNVLLFRNNDMRLRGDVQLSVSGPLERLVVKGTSGLTGGYYTGNIDFLSKIGTSEAPVTEGDGFLFSFTDPPLKNAVLDIKVTTIEPFRIRNNLIRGVLRPELSLKGTGELPFLVGSIYIDPSRVILPSGRLQVESGLLSFLAEKPDRPQLDLVAHSKVLGYDINVITRGPLNDPVISLSSSPALPNDDLLLLLLTGQPPKQDIAGGASSRATTNVMVYLGRDFLSKWLEDESGGGDESIFDRFELNYGRGVTKSGEQTVEGTFQLSEQKTGKRRVYYLAAEKDKYDAYNYGLRLVFRFE